MISIRKLVSLLVVSVILLISHILPAQQAIVRTGESSLKLSLNAYSFNGPLRSGEMNLDDLLLFCAGQNLDAVDITGYYFPGYPEVPSDEYIYSIKRKASLLGIDISGTGVRNDFVQADAEKRRADVALVKNWIVVASKLGAPVLRIFSGKAIPEGYSRDEVESWMIADIKECVEFGKAHGVMVAIQNHHDFIRNADDVKRILRKVDHEWFGLILDTGSYREGDPYAQIEQTIPYAVNWQIKEKIFVNGVEEKTNLDKLMTMIKASAYRGYLPIETLGSGDPYQKVPVFLEAVRNAMNKEN